MKDCLVTSLAAESTNSNLPKIGILTINRIHVDNEVEADAAFAIPRKILQEGVTFTITIEGDGYFMNSYGGESVGKEITVQKSSSNKTVYTSNGNYNINIERKYGYKISSLPKGYKCNIADIYYTSTSAISSVGYYGFLSDANPETINNVVLSDSQLSKVFYRSEDIGKLINLTQLYYSSTEIGKDFPKVKMSDLGKLTHLTGNNQIPCAVGSIEDFVTAQRAGGRTTFDGNMDLHYIGYSGKVTFDGSVIENIASGLITWTASTITFRGVTVNA